MRAARVLLFAIAALLPACARSAPPPTGAPAEVENPRRIISLVPSLTDAVAFHGRGRDLVAITAYCDRPADAPETVAIIQDSLRPNPEALLALRPDLVLTLDWKEEGARAELARAGVSVAVLPNPPTLREIAENLAVVGGLLGDTAAGRVRADSWHAAVEAVLDATKDRPRRRAVLLLSEGGTWTVGKGSYHHEILDRLGLDNIFGQEDFAYREVGLERILAGDPEVILILGGHSPVGRTAEVLARTSAGKSGRIHPISSWRLFSRNGPGLLFSIREVSDLTKPDRP